MMRGLVAFSIGTVLLIWLVGAAAYLLSDRLGNFAALVFLPAMVIPFFLAYVGQHLSGGVGNPFRGLVWGGGGWIILIWVLGLVAAGAAVLIGLGLGWQSWDPGMSSFIELQIKQAGSDIPASQQGMLKIAGYVTAFTSPTIGVLIGAALGCLSTFPWYGWFLRRLLVLGRTRGVLITTALIFISGLAGGLVANPTMGDVPVIGKILLIGTMTVCLVPASVWIFLKSKSAVLPALAQAAFSGGLQGIMPFLSGGEPWLVAPAGVIVSAVALGAGLALWIWQDPGGQDLAVAGTGFDGSPLTPEQLAQMEHS